MKEFKVGIGQDSHRIYSQKKKAKPLILGGVLIDKKIFVEANSDGDVVFHALCNALSSAIGGDSLGTWAEKMYLQGVTDSKEYLKVVMSKVKKGGFKVNSVSIAVEAKRPKITLSQVQEMKEKIGKLLGIAKDCIGITFTSGEELTSFGKGEGIQVLAIATLFK